MEILPPSTRSGVRASNNHRTTRTCPRRRTGLDHVSFAVATREYIGELARRARSHGYGEPAIKDTPHAAILVLRDPDRIQVEV